MAKGILSTSELIESVKQRAAVPDAQVTFDDSAILRFINEEMDNSIVPFIMSMHEDYFVFTEEVPLVANQSRYTIPYRAIGSKFRDIKFKDNNNNLYPMTRIEQEDRSYFGLAKDSYHKTFYLESDMVVLYPDVGNTVNGSLSFLYYLRPNELVQEDRAAKILSIDSNNGILTLTNIPSHFTNGMLIDLNKAKSTNRILAFDLTVLSVDTINNQVTVDPSSLPLFLSVGDEVASAGECTNPQIPAELHTLLAERVCNRIMAAQGDNEGLAMSNQKLAEMEVKAGSMINNRSEGTPRKISNFNSILRYSKLGRRRFFY